MLSAAFAGYSLNIYTVLLTVFVSYIALKVSLSFLSIIGLRVTVAHANAQSYDGYLSAIRPASVKIQVEPEVLQEVEASVEPEVITQVEAIVEEESISAQDENLDFDTITEPERVVEPDSKVPTEEVYENKSIVESLCDGVEQPVDEPESKEFDTDNVIRLSDLRPEDFDAPSFTDESLRTEIATSADGPLQTKILLSADVPAEECIGDEFIDNEEYVTDLSEDYYEVVPECYDSPDETPYPDGLVILGEHEVLSDDNAIDPTFWKLAS